MPDRRVVLISGASSGIGAACAEHLAALGFTVIAGIRSCDEAAHRSNADGIHHVQLDVTDAGSIARAVTTVRSICGDAGLAGLVNNAGISVMGPIEAVPIAECRRQFDVNVFGTIALTQACLPLLRQARGRIVIMSSIAGLTSTAYAGVYSASKFALEAVADALRQEMHRFDVSVSVVEPGATQSNIWGKVEHSWNGLMTDPDIAPLYADAIARMRTSMADYARLAIPATRTAGAVAHALSAGRPRTRYLVGAESRVRAALQAWLPDRLHDALVRRVMHLP